jgi:hypothetical protein
MFTRAQHKMTSWMAVAVILLSALAPSVSHAITSANNDNVSWQQICGSHADSRTSPEKDPDQNTATEPSDHCPFCLLHANNWAPPGHAALSFTTRDDKLLCPCHGIKLAPTGAAWLSPHSRAPPSQS